MDELVRNKVAERLKEADVQLVCVSLGTPYQAKKWLEITKFDGELYVDDKTYGDPRLGVEPAQSVSYGVFKLKRGPEVLRLDDPVASKLADETALKFPDMEDLGKKDGTLTIWPGDVFQTGGCFVLGPGNVCDFMYRSKYAGDHPSVSDVVRFSTGKEQTGDEIVYESTKAWLQWMRMDGKVRVGWSGSIVGEIFVWRLVAGISSMVKKYGATFGIGAVGALVGWKKATVKGNEAIRAKSSSLGYALGSLLAFSTLKPIYLALTRKRIKYLKPSDITLLTPIDIDNKVLESAMPECDCGQTMAAMPMLGLREPGDVEGKKELGRQRFQMWASELESSNEFQTILCYVREFLAKVRPSVR